MGKYSCVEVMFHIYETYYGLRAQINFLLTLGLCDYREVNGMKAAPFVGERVGSKANQQGGRREMCGRVNAIKAQKCALISGFNMAYRRLAKRRNNFVTVASNDIFFVAVI